MLRPLEEGKAALINWQSIKDLPDVALDGREVLLAIRNRLGTSDGGDGHRLHPEHPFLYELVSWEPRVGRWEASRDEDGCAIYLERDEADFWAEINAPDLSPAAAPQLPK